MNDFRTIVAIFLNDFVPGQTDVLNESFETGNESFSGRNEFVAKNSFKFPLWFQSGTRGLGSLVLFDASEFLLPVRSEFTMYDQYLGLTAGKEIIIAKRKRQQRILNSEPDLMTHNVKRAQH